MKLKKDLIGVDDLEQYLADASDFAFELQILRMLTDRGVPCDHNGQYEDPNTKKFREFDIRLRLTRGDMTVVAAIECKAIGQHFPLLVSTVPRNDREAHHQVYFHTRREHQPRGAFEIAILVPEGMEGMEGTPINESCLYPSGSPVGKSTAQVGRRDTKDAELYANDAEFFEKWSQALHSLTDLVDEIGSEEFIHERWNGRQHSALALPIVVVPNGCLWSVGYDHHGQCTDRPAQVERVSIYINRSYRNGFPVSSLNVSHLEVMTESGLSSFHDRFLCNEERMRHLFQPINRDVEG